jgi:nucleotide-binding universal stress UspA family protein
MLNEKHRLKCVLAIDPDTANLVAQTAVLEHLQALFAHIELTIEPVLVVPLDLTSVSSGLELREFEDQVKSIESSIADLAQEMPNLRLSEPVILKADFSSGQEWVRLLCEKADRSSADLIVVNTHARSWVGRFILGSFTEALLEQTHLPILVFGPAVGSPSSSGSVLVMNPPADWLPKLGHPIQEIAPSDLNERDTRGARALALSRSQVSPHRLRSLFQSENCPILVFP